MNPLGPVDAIGDAASSGAPPSLTCLPVTGLGEIRAGDDLAVLLASAVALHDGDILAVTSKAVSKAEAAVTRLDKAAAEAQDTGRVVAARGATTIVRTRSGLVMAAAGVDASNTEPGTVVLLPRDPDGSARALRNRLLSASGRNIAVLVTDTAGRAWREGQTDIAIGAAGLEVRHVYAGADDGYGNRLTVTSPAVADELAGATDLVKGKLNRCPAAVVRGLSHLVLPTGDDGPGARALIRDEAADLFGYGAREAVLRAVGGRGEDLRGFGRPCDAADLLARLRECCPTATVSFVAGNRVEVDLPPAASVAEHRERGHTLARVEIVAFALGWRRDSAHLVPDGDRLRLVAGVP